MADVKKTIDILFRGVDNVSDVADRIGGKVSGLGANLGAVLDPFADLAKGALLAEGALAGLAAGGLALAYTKSVQLNGAMTGLQKVLDDLENVGDLKGAITDLSNEYGVAAASITESVTTWKQAGFETNEALMLAKDNLDLVIAGDMGAAKSTEVLVASLKGFKLPAEEAGRLIDILNEVSNNYATNTEELAIAMGMISPIANQMGFSLEETAGMVTPVIEVFRSGSEAATALKTGLLKLIDDSKPVRDALAQLGVSQRDANGELRSGKDILFDVSKAFETANHSQKLFLTKELVGIEQSARMVEVFDNLTKSTEITAVALDAAGSAADEVAVRMKSSEVVVKKLGTAFENMAAELGDGFRPAIDQILIGFTEVQKAISESSQEGLFDDVYAAFGDFGERARESLSEIAANLPDALAQVDFSPLIESIQGVGGEIGDLVDGFFGGLDLTSADGMAAAIQMSVDALANFQNTIGGVFDSFGPLIDLIGVAVDAFGDMDAEAAASIGSVVGFGAQLSGVAGLLGPFGEGISGAAGAIKTLGGGAKTAVSGAQALVTALGPGGLVLAAGAAGLAIGSLINQLPGVADGVQGIIGEIDNFLGGALSAGPTVDEIEKIDNAFFAAQQKARRAFEEAEKLGTAVDGIPDGKNIDITTTADEARAQLQQIGVDVSGMSDNEILLAIGVDAGDAQNKIQGINDAFSAAGQQAERTADAARNVGDAVGGIPDEKNVDIATTADDARAKLDRLGADIESLTADEFELAIGMDDSTLQADRQRIDEFMALDGTVVEFKPEADTTEAKQALEDLVPPDKRLELQVELDMTRIEADADMFEARMAAIQTSVEWEAKLEIAQVEAATEQMQSAFESINSTINSTGDVLSSIFGLLGEDLDLQSKWEVFDQIERENDLRERAVEMQERLVEAQISALARWEARLDSDEPIALNISTDNLAPHLEMIWTEVIEALQDQAVLEGGEMLVGMLPTATAT